MSQQIKLTNIYLEYDGANGAQMAENWALIDVNILQITLEVRRLQSTVSDYKAIFKRNR